MYAYLKLLAWVLLFSSIFSLTVTYSVFRYRLQTQPIPSSQTIITPYEDYVSGIVTDIRTGKTLDTTVIEYASIIGNTLVLFVPISLIAVVMKKRRSNPSLQP